MLLTKTVVIVVSNFNEENLKQHGYSVKRGQKIEIVVEHLPHSSHKVVQIQCDYCGVKFEREYRHYLKGRREFPEDTCKDCAVKKIAKIHTKKYGGIGLASLQLKEKAQNTNKERYGDITPLQNKEIIEKAKKTCQEKYGGTGMGSLITRGKIESFNLQHYGVRNPSQREDIKRKKEETCFAHYGVKSFFGDPNRTEELTKKAKESLYKNGKTPSSKMEEGLNKLLIEIYGLENCFPSFLVSPLTFDCLLIVNNQKIDVEYDGWYWHKNTEERDRKRNYKVMSLGYKVLRVKSKFELPTKEQIQKAVDYLVNQGHHYKEIILDI